VGLQTTIRKSVLLIMGSLANHQLPIDRRSFSVNRDIFAPGKETSTVC
jgi:hypothetical protein